MQDNGLLTVIRGRSKRVGCKLTPEGDDYIRMRMPVVTVQESWPWLRKLNKHSAANSGFALEVDLLKSDYDKLTTIELYELEDKLDPLRCRGLVDSASDIEGRVGYKLIDAGREALTHRRPPAPKKWPAYDQTLGQEYIRLYHAELAEREDWKPVRPNSVAIPVSAGMWPERRSSKRG